MFIMTLHDINGINNQIEELVVLFETETEVLININKCSELEEENKRLFKKIEVRNIMDSRSYEIIFITV